MDGYGNDRRLGELLAAAAAAADSQTRASVGVAHKFAF